MTKTGPILLGLLLLTPTAASILAADGDPDKTIVIRDGEVVRLDGEDAPFVFYGDGTRRGFIGVRPIEMTPDLRAHFGAPKDAGVLIGEVDANGPAGKAGLLVGDIVTAVDGSRIESGGDLSRSVRRKKEGDSVQLEIVRDKSKKTLTVAVAERKSAEFSWSDLPRVHPRAWTMQDWTTPEVEVRVPRRMDLNKMNERLEELEKRLREL